MGNNSKHDQHTHSIMFKPGLIGLDGIVLSTDEVNLFDERGVLKRQPDNLLFDPSTHTLYQVEYKCNDTNSNAHHAVYQLKDANDRLRRVFPSYRVVNLYVHDNYKIEVVK